MLKKIPFPLSGVILGVLGLGNLLESFSPAIKWFCGTFGTVLALVLIAKMIWDKGALLEALRNPILASVLGTFPMSLMLLAGYGAALHIPGTLWLWYVAIALHIALMLYFTYNFVIKLKIENVHASYYIVYVGIIIASVTSPDFHTEALGSVIFWFGFIAYVPLLVLVSYRYLKVRNMESASKLLFCIFAAPANLCLVGYHKAIADKSLLVIITLMVVGQLFYLLVLAMLPKLLTKTFFPSYASLTFPLVITATELKLTNGELIARGIHSSVLAVAVKAETIIAVIFVVYALIRYFNFIFFEQREQGLGISTFKPR